MADSGGVRVTSTRIHDLAAEFGISSEQLMGMLKEQDIFVRSHLSPLKPEQVALMRARWEREKRKQKDAPAAPKRRRAVKAVEPVAAVEPDGRPKRRRRTAAEMAAVDAEAQAEAAIEAERELKAREALEAAKAVDEEEKPSLEERAAARDPDSRAAQTGGERHARRRGARSSPTRRLGGAGRDSAGGAAAREGEEAQEGQEIAGGSGSGGPEHLAHPGDDQRAGGEEGRPPARGGAELPRGRGAEAARREGAREDAGARDRVYHGLRAREYPEGARQGDRRLRLQGARADGDDQPAPRFRHDRADRVSLRLPGGARRGVCPRRVRGAAQGRAGRSQATRAGGHGHGPRGPRQDLVARLRPEGQRRGGRRGRHHATHRRLSGHAERRALHHVPGHAGP